MFMGAVIGFAAAVLLVSCLLLSGSRVFAEPPLTPPPAAAAGPPAATSTEKIKSLDRTAIRGLLKKLSESPVPKGEKMGAMCYDTAPPPRRADYVCPKCGERTLYDETKMDTKEWVEKGRSSTVAWEIPECRREFKELQKLAGDSISLDESQFCKKCSPKVTEPKLVLHITLKGEKARDVEKIKHGDIRILREFLAGELLAEGDRNSISPLKKSLPRLQELLGVILEEK
jgi:hypothetical protein